MANELWLEVVLVLLLIVANGFFSGSEMAVWRCAAAVSTSSRCAPDQRCQLRQAWPYFLMRVGR